ncbi:nucleoside hydrolase [Pelagicoccus albus]|uniref:Nucleoside hydrolase n=1 Tax=Pelagicoccus albus TaxID=415222 RepID=A0A7X1B3X2_9BACT|nr:nucleoside hydrolase [Pelagicoccus albus]MBC2604959.1 nucleoside hydrolase [Pelagicoccus albus]
MRSVIIDSDWGGDVMQLASILLSRPTEYELLGATVTFGNATHNQNLDNAGAMLRFLGMDSQISRYPGALAPSGKEFQPEGDEAHGRTGLGDAVLPLSSYLPEEQSTVDFLLERLEQEIEDSITLIATGPQTNVAEAIRQAPETMARLKEIRIMGGCIDPMQGYRVDENLKRTSEKPIARKGNITETAEFNFQQAPHDAKVVLESGIPIALFPMDCTHQLTFTEERANRLKDTLSSEPEKLQQLLDLLQAPEAMDQAKFGINSVMHDVHTTVSMVAPELYLGRHGTVSIEEDGEVNFSPEAGGRHWACERITNPDAVFEILLASLEALLIEK